MIYREWMSNWDRYTDMSSMRSARGDAGVMYGLTRDHRLLSDARAFGNCQVFSGEPRQMTWESCQREKVSLTSYLPLKRRFHIFFLFFNIFKQFHNKPTTIVKASTHSPRLSHTTIQPHASLRPPPSKPPNVISTTHTRTSNFDLSTIVHL